MSNTSIHAQIGLACKVTDPATGLGGDKGQPATRVSMPLANQHYEITLSFDGAGNTVTIDLSDGTATGAVLGVKAAGSIDFAGLPAAAETIGVNDLTYTFVAGTPADNTEIEIGVDAAETASNAAAAISDRDPAVEAVSVMDSVTVLAAFNGTYGNAITLAAAATNVTVSGATFSGGIDGVTLAGAGVDHLGAALPVMAAVHGILVTASAGGADVEMPSKLLGSATPDSGVLTYSRAGRADLVDMLSITSSAAGTVAKVFVAARN